MQLEKHVLYFNIYRSVIIFGCNQLLHNFGMTSRYGSSCCRPLTSCAMRQSRGMLLTMMHSTLLNMALRKAKEYVSHYFPQQTMLWQSIILTRILSAMHSHIFPCLNFAFLNLSIDSADVKILNSLISRLSLIKN